MEWFEKIIEWLLMIWSGLKKTWSAKHSKEEMQVKTVLIPCGISAISWATSIRLRWFLNHFKVRDRSTFDMKILKSSVVIFLVKKSKYRSAILWSKAETELWQVVGYFSVYKAPNGMIFEALEI